MTAVQEYIPTETLNIKALQDRALKLWEVDQASALDLGHALCAVRDAMREEHAAFAKWYRANGLEENRVYYCIRRAEGKTAQSAPAPMPVRLNKNNLLLAKYAPQEGKYTHACVRVGPDGTTVTDGFTVMRVSLPEGSACAESSVVPSPFMANLSGPAELTFGRDAVTAKSGNITQTTAKYTRDFPNAESVINTHPPCQDEVPNSGVAFQVDVRALGRLLEALNEVAAKGLEDKAKISIWPDVLRADFICDDGQRFEGFAQIRPTR